MIKEIEKWKLKEIKIYMYVFFFLNFINILFYLICYFNINILTKFVFLYF